jgi:hypothetical protein
MHQLHQLSVRSQIILKSDQMKTWQSNYVQMINIMPVKKLRIEFHRQLEAIDYYQSMCGTSYNYKALWKFKQVVYLLKSKINSNG